MPVLELVEKLPTLVQVLSASYNALISAYVLAVAEEGRDMLRFPLTTLKGL